MIDEQSKIGFLKIYRWPTLIHNVNKFGQIVIFDHEADDICYAHIYQMETLLFNI